MSELLLTLDVDWAPDFVCEAIAAELDAAGVRATWFATHDGDYLASLRARPDIHEVGIHPNFLPGSTHGSEPSAVLDHLLRIVPEAKATRSHGLMQWGDLFRLLIEKGLRVDSSTFLPELPVEPVEQWRDGRSLLRVPFSFADDHELEKPTPEWSLARHRRKPGLKVFTFHPIHLYLNTTDLAVYGELKTRSRDLRAAPRAAIDELLASTDASGPRTLFRELVQELAAQGGGLRLADLLVSDPRPG